MKKLPLLAALAIIGIATLACSFGGAVAPTSTPLPPPPPPPTDIVIPTARPTATELPPPTDVPTPAPVGIGETVQYGSLEITLLKVEPHDLIMPGGKYYYYTKPGQTYVDLAVLVRNTSSKVVNEPLKYMYVVEASGDVWFTGFAAFQTVDKGVQLDPFVSLKIPEAQLDGDTNVSLGKDTYLRLVYLVADNQDIIFGIDNSPQFIFHVNKK